MGRHDGSESYRDVLTYEIESDELVSEAVVRAVATASGDEPVTRIGASESSGCLDPLFDAVDPDALDSLFDGSHRDQSGSEVCTTFSYYGYEVTVHSDGVVHLEGASAAGEPGRE